MKTLKQRMETELDTSLYLCHDFNEIESEFLRLTKEWLTQNQITFSDGNYASDFEIMWAKYKSDVAQVRQWDKENPVNAFIMGYMLAQKELLEALE